jgi:hypothetical protein
LCPLKRASREKGETNDFKDVTLLSNRNCKKGKKHTKEKFVVEKKRTKQQQREKSIGRHGKREN